MLSMKRLWSCIVDFENQPLETYPNGISLPLRTRSDRPARPTRSSGSGSNIFHWLLRKQLERVGGRTQATGASNAVPLHHLLSHPPYLSFGTHPPPCITFAGYAPRLSHLELRECLPDSSSSFSHLASNHEYRTPQRPTVP